MMSRKIITFISTDSLSFSRLIILIATFFAVTQCTPNFTRPENEKWTRDVVWDGAAVPASVDFDVNLRGLVDAILLPVWPFPSVRSRRYGPTYWWASLEGVLFSFCTSLLILLQWMDRWILVGRPLFFHSLNQPATMVFFLSKRNSPMKLDTNFTAFFLRLQQKSHDSFDSSDVYQ